jgi:hypothetical protein
MTETVVEWLKPWCNNWNCNEMTENANGMT